MKSYQDILGCKSFNHAGETYVFLPALGSQEGSMNGFVCACVRMLPLPFFGVGSKYPFNQYLL